MRVAALDLGSNSFHLLVAESRPDGSFAPLVREKEMLRLGDVVAREGKLPRQAGDEAVATVRRFVALAGANGADEVVAYGTAALREAENGAEVVERIEAETGIAVEIVSGEREARLVYRAVRESVLMDPSPVLCADLGGGSLELAVGDRERLRHATSLHLGVGRLTAEMVESDPPSRQERRRLRKRVDAELSEAAEELLRLEPRQLIGSSGSLCALARGAVAFATGKLPASANQLSVESRELARFTDHVFALTSSQRASLPGIEARRAELLPAAAVVAEALLAMTGLDVLTTSEWALREGMVLRALRHHSSAELSGDPREIRRESVLSLCRRCAWRERHARAVSRMACELFDATRELHGGGDEERELLELAGFLHDIGEHVSHDGHDRHGAYVIENGGLRGFAPEEVQQLACLVRYHTRGRPKGDFAAYGALESEKRETVAYLLSLLRLADGLDVSHGGVIGPLAVRLGRDRAVISAPARGEAELERWIFGRKKAMFEEVFGLEATLEITGSRKRAVGGDAKDA